MNDVGYPLPNNSGIWLRNVKNTGYKVGSTGLTGHRAHRYRHRVEGRGG